MKVNVAVCGRFHYHNWVKYLWEAGLLERFYYSHKINAELGIPEHAARNKWLKEYLLALHGRILGERFLHSLLPFYHKEWQAAVLKDWVRPDVAHVLLHGTALRLIERCQSEGTCVIGEAVNAHPDIVNGILAPEHERLGLRYQRYDQVWERLRQEYDHCHYILVSSGWVARSFREKGIAPDKILKLAYPTGIGGGKKKRLSSGRKVRVLCVASIQVRKGQHYLLEAVRHLNRKHGRVRFELTLVGSVSDKDFFSKLREKHVPFDHIRHVPNQEMVNFMNSFDVFVLPSLEDGFGIVVSEALQAGVPVVTTRNAGAADAIVDGQNGFVVSAQNSSALSDAIGGAIDLSPPPGLLALDAIPDWRSYAEKLTQLYSICLASAAGRVSYE
ncbi:MAG: glycosyltransferase family 4 protein [Thermodesulfobacteriota bacterium]